MARDMAEAVKVVEEYIGGRGKWESVGWGVSGFVFSRAEAGVPTVIKVHKQRAGYEREIEVYRLLKREKIRNLMGFTIPRLRKSRDRLMLIEMDFVFPPFMLDFAGAHLSQPDYEEHVWEQWMADVQRVFGANAPLVLMAHDQMKNLGVWYMDIRPSNIKVAGHPLAEPEDSADMEDPSPY